MATYLADCLMPKVDVATMAHALEARAPLLDHTFAEFALTLPQSYLMDRAGGKRVLRAVLARYVPRSLVERPKQGFTVPLDESSADGWLAARRSLPAARLWRRWGSTRPESQPSTKSISVGYALTENASSRSSP